MKTKNDQKEDQTNWRSKLIALTRILFGLVWTVDAYFKWQPAFPNDFVSYLQETYDGQPHLIQSWLNFWINLVNIDPHLFARIIAMGETAIAFGLLFGIFSNLDYAMGPYTPGATDVGAGIIYVFGFLGLFLLAAGQCYGLDRVVRPKLGTWRFLSSPPLK